MIADSEGILKSRLVWWIGIKGYDSLGFTTEIKDGLCFELFNSTGGTFVR